jgi:hypothetical protein
MMRTLLLDFRHDAAGYGGMDERWEEKPFRLPKNLNFFSR